MPNHKVKSFGEIRRLNLRVKHADEVEVTRAGSHYRARFRGHANCVFGSSAEQATQRLLNAVAKNLGIVPIPITKFEKQLLEACR